jgi:glycosyltransferase involved in cell wall biosynthesis
VPLVAFDARDAFVAMPHGSGIYVHRLLQALARRAPAGLELWPVPGGRRGPEVVWEQLGLPRAIRSRGAALIHGPDSFLPLRRSCPGVVTIHDLGFAAIPGDMPRATELKYRALVPRGARSAERVICPSEFTADDLERRYRVPRERIRVIAEAPALPAGSAPAPPGPYLLAAGDLRPKKNLSVLVDAFVRLHREGLPHRLILAGADCGSGSILRRLAGASPVELPGFVGDQQLDALIRGADALVLPGIYEGFGLVALDAMARGCPTVLARAGALPETGGEAAAYFEPDDAGELAAVLRTLLADGGERDRRASAGRAWAARFSWDAAADETLDVYAELL